MDAAQVGYNDERGRALFAEIERRVRGVPAVEDFSYACTPPMGYVRLSADVARQGVAVSDGHVSAGLNIVGIDYFRVMRIPILQGRAFDGRDTDRTTRVAIVNPQLANALWPGESPLGRWFSEKPNGPMLEVIGIAAASKYRHLFEEPQPYFYVPVSQRYTALRVLHVRTRSSPPESLAPEIEGVIREIEPALPVYDVQSMTDALDGGYGFFLVRTAAIFAAVLGALAAVLAIVGLYGVVSCAVTERSREIGIRLALGAGARNIARLVFLEGALLAGTGAVFGAVAAIGIARVISRALFGVAPTDPISFITAALCLAVVTLVAASVPAARAMTTDPIEVLRE
jgi:predicted permease